MDQARIKPPIKNIFWGNMNIYFTLFYYQLQTILVLIHPIDIILLLQSHETSSYPVFPECVARFPSLCGFGGWSCVRQTLCNCSQPFATVHHRPREVVPMAGSAKAVIFVGFKRRVASFRLAGVALCDIPTCFRLVEKSSCVAGTILLRRLEKMRCNFVAGAELGQPPSSFCVANSTVDVSCCSTPYTHILHSKLYTPHSTLYTLHLKLCTPHFTLVILHSALHTPHFTLCNLHFTLHTLHSTVCTPHSTLHTPHFTLYIPYTLHSTLQPPPCHTLQTRLPTQHSTSSHPTFGLDPLPHSTVYSALKWQQGKMEKCTRLFQQHVSHTCSTWLHSGSWAASCFFFSSIHQIIRTSLVSTVLSTNQLTMGTVVPWLIPCLTLALSSMSTKHVDVQSLCSMTNRQPMNIWLWTINKDWPSPKNGWLWMIANTKKTPLYIYIYISY